MKIPYANIQFQDENIPLSQDFDDIYFDQKNGIAESIFVFFDHNNLTNRFSYHQEHQLPFTILETGFGTGLNFLILMELYLKNKYTFPLKFISIEAFPISLTDLHKIHQKTLINKEALNIFLEIYSSLLPHNYPEKKEASFFSTIKLEVYFGNIKDEIIKIEELVDAFFLDGHAPSKNPEMWTFDIIKNLQKLSKIGTTFATFTATGQIRRDLVAVGFTVEKVKGYGNKREMLRGRIK